MRKPKTQAQLQREVDSFNAQFPVGSQVDYYEVVGEGAPQELRTRTPAEVLSGHTAVVWLEGKSGCVCCSHCFAPTLQGAP